MGYLIVIFFMGCSGVFPKRWQYDDMAIVECTPCTPEKDAEKVNCTTDLSRILLLLYLFQGC